MTSPKTQLEWSPPVGLVAIGWAAAVGAALFAVFTNDQVGRLLLGLAALVLAVLALHGTVARPRLAADNAGITLRSLTRRRYWTWAQINVRVVRTRRLGRQVSTLELDADEDLAILGWFDLGTSAQDVAEALRDLRT